MSAEILDLTPVPKLAWYETLRKILEPYQPATGLEVENEFSTGDIIAAIERHHGVMQGPVGKTVTEWVQPQDFVRAMRYLGFIDASGGGIQLVWPVKKKGRK